MTARRPPIRFRSYIYTFAVLAVFLILAHGPLLRLPFFWDEAGQFVPASLDIYRSGAWIPFSTVPNVHPPAMMACLAGVWTVFGYSIAATRVAMLLIAATGALFTFLLAIELARGSPGTPAFIALAFLCANPLFFAQSMLAQLDMPAMCLTALALLLFVQDRLRASAIVSVVLVLVKETGLVAPAVFACWLLYERRGREALWFLLPVPPLLVWLFALHHSTGYWLGNPAFSAYNLRYPLNAARIALALLRRLYYLFAGSGHIIGTAALIWAWKRMPLLHTRPWRIAASFVAAHVLTVTVLGGAVLERYLLPALPVTCAAFAIALQGLMPRNRKMATAALILCLITANFVNPVYPFPFENNLAFVDFVELERSVAATVESRGGGSVTTVFPVADALRRPDLGFVEQSRKVKEIADFSPAEVAKLKSDPPRMVVVCDREWDPLNIFGHPALRDFAAKHYGYIPEMRAEEIAAELSMHIAGRWRRHGLHMELLEQSGADAPDRL